MAFENLIEFCWNSVTEKFAVDLENCSFFFEFSHFATNYQPFFKRKNKILQFQNFFGKIFQFLEFILITTTDMIWIKIRILPIFKIQILLQYLFSLVSSIWKLEKKTRKLFYSKIDKNLSTCQLNQFYFYFLNPFFYSKNFKWIWLSSNQFLALTIKKKKLITVPNKKNNNSGKKVIQLFLSTKRKQRFPCSVLFMNSGKNKLQVPKKKFLIQEKFI